jgi:hypothetical protein
MADDNTPAYQTGPYAYQTGPQAYEPLPGITSGAPRKPWGLQEPYRPNMQPPLSGWTQDRMATAAPDVGAPVRFTKIVAPRTTQDI